MRLFTTYGQIMTYWIHRKVRLVDMYINRKHPSGSKYSCLHDTTSIRGKNVNLERPMFLY